MTFSRLAVRVSRAIACGAGLQEEGGGSTKSYEKMTDQVTPETSLSLQGNTARISRFSKEGVIISLSRLSGFQGPRR